jgi:rod shape-determining protein MreC
MNFLLRYGNLILFLFLEGISLYMVGNYNKKQNAIYQSSANLVTGVIYDNFSSVRKFLSMQEIADSLARENAELRTQLEASKYALQPQTGLVKLPLDTSTIRPDTAQQKDVMQQFNYIAAEVIKNSIAADDNYLTINRGSLHGVQPDMGVITSDGIVGIVRNVTPHFAQVMSILNSKTRISAGIKRNRYFGSLRWRVESRNPKQMILTEIPKHGDVVRGDTIVTTGFSEVFPGELRIGKVSDFRIENGTNFYTIDVDLWTDMANVRYVYVVNNLLISELKQFKN